MKRTCTQCSKEFLLTDSEIDFYNKKGLQLPKRCEECCAANKAARSQQPNSSSVPDKENCASSGASSRQQQNSSGKGRITPMRIVLSLVILVFAFFFGDGLLNSDNDAPQNSTPTSQTSAPAFENNAPSSQSFEAGAAPVNSASQSDSIAETQLVFRNNNLLEQHYEKHGIEMGFASAQEYESAASAVVYSENVLHKTEKEDGDDVYYIEESNEFVVVSSDGYLRTYFYPSAGKDYFDRQ